MKSDRQAVQAAWTAGQRATTQRAVEKTWLTFLTQGSASPLPLPLLP